MFNSRRIALKVENLPEISQVDETLGLNKEDETHSQDAEWVEVRLK